MPVRELLGGDKVSDQSLPDLITGNAVKGRRELPANERIEEEENTIFNQTVGQGLAGLQDVGQILARPIRATLGEIVYTPGQGFKHVGPEDALRMEEEGLLDFPGAAKKDPTSAVGSAFRFAGQTLPLVGPLGAASTTVRAVKAGTEAVTKLGKFKQFPRKVVSEMGERFRQSPLTTTAGETGLGFTAGFGGGVLAEVFPDSVAARFIGEIGGGLIPQILPFQIAVKVVGGLRNFFRKAKSQFSEPGGMQRAKARTGRAVAGSRGEALRQLDQPTTIDNATGLPVLTSAQQTGVPGLLDLEESIIRSSEALTGEANTQIANANRVIQESLNDISPTPSVVAADQIQAGNKYFENLLDTRLQVAAQSTAEQVANVGPVVTKELANRIAREEVEKALIAARKQEDALYKLIDPDTKAPFSNSLSLLKATRKELSRAEQEDIADVANILATLGPKKPQLHQDVVEFDFANATPGQMVQRLADDMHIHELKASEIDAIAETTASIGDTLFARGLSREDAVEQALEMVATATEKNTARVLEEARLISLGGVQPLTTVRELRGVQRKLREVMRQATEKGDFNKARIARNIANAITDDLADNVGGVEMQELIKRAVTFSRNLHDRFDSRTVGKILSKDERGTPRVPPGLTLEESIGVTGPKAREAMDDLLKVFDSPEAPGSGMVISASEDYLRGKFLKAAVDRGSLNVTSARKFMTQNEDILGRLPNLKRQFDEVIESGDALAVTQRQRARISLDDPKVSKATMFIEKGPVDTFKSMGRLKPVDAEREMQLLMNRVAKDETGEATLGLKSGFVEFLLTGSRREVRDVEGLPFLSGFALRDTLSNPAVNAMAKRLFSRGDQQRLAIITQDLIRMEKRRTARAATEGIISDKPSKFVEMLSGIVGAAVGRNTARKFGFGGTVQIPGIVAKRFRDMTAAQIKDPAGRLLRDAVHDETLFRELLEEPLDEAGQLSELATRRLNTWAFNVLAEHGGAFEEE